MKALDALSKYGIPIHSYIAAVQSLTDIELTPEQYRNRIEELSGNKCTAEDKYVRIHYQYIVQETVRRSMNTDVINMDDIFELATKRAVKYCKESPWSFANRDGVELTAKVDVQGNVKPKKGAKKALAKEVWEKRKGEEHTRKEWIAILVDEVKLTPAGASTYYSNLKNNKL